MSDWVSKRGLLLKPKKVKISISKMTDVEDEVSPRTKEKGKTDGEFERFHTFLGESTIHGLQNLHRSQGKDNHLFVFIIRRSFITLVFTVDEYTKMAP